MNMKKIILFGIILIILVFSTACKGKEETSMENYEKALKLVKEKNYDKAKTLLKKSIDESPQNGDLYFLLGNVYRNEEKYEDALGYYYSAIEKYPNLKEGYNNIAGIYMLQGEYDNAMEVLEEGLGQFPQFSELIFKKAQLVFFQDKYEESIKLMESISDKDNYVDTYRIMGICYLQLGNSHKALENLKIYLNKTPDGFTGREEVIHIVKEIE
ncbi:MAG: tetratricopeptide repeat protein [Marinisporobacter sp.]|nr:tetratricopeptide repeat protein [Marinisporobacter sp.]